LSKVELEYIACVKNLTYILVIAYLFILKLFVPDRINILIVGLQKILSLLEAEDADVRIHAVKVVANLAAEGCCLTCLY